MRTGINDGPPNSIYQYGSVKNANPKCEHCNGEGIVDSGGILPWGDPAMVMCGCVHSTWPGKYDPRGGQ